jgi:hypothetical protein
MLFRLLSARRRKATTSEWPLLNGLLDGMGRDELMARHQSNHLTVAYVPDAKADQIVRLSSPRRSLRVFGCLRPGSRCNCRRGPTLQHGMI